mmetsp:Transcript_20958/g.49447  ORF Transcript_20958/g.49447 Transcript_20958/m.49447 type:complete len:91 (+) Transcript_20958:382-654(+)
MGWDVMRCDGTLRYVTLRIGCRDVLDVCIHACMHAHSGLEDPRTRCLKGISFSSLVGYRQQLSDIESSRVQSSRVQFEIVLKLRTTLFRL